MLNRTKGTLNTFMCTYLRQFILDIESFMIKMERVHNNIVIVKNILCKAGKCFVTATNNGKVHVCRRKLSPPSADIQDLTIRYSVAREARGTAYGITSLKRPKLNNTTKIPYK